jgi:hypothetical protein
MPDDRSVLQVLRSELAFLERGGYRGKPYSDWRPNFIFEDSPSCPNSKSSVRLCSCEGCVLMQFVPPDRRETRVPCRHIVLTERGETVNSFYEWGTEEELETALAHWLRSTIALLEQSGQTHARVA